MFVCGSGCMRQFLFTFERVPLPCELLALVTRASVVADAVCALDAGEAAARSS